MIDPAVVEAFNTRQTVDLNNIKKMKPAELDRVKATGSSAENLMKNREFAMFVHQYKFELCDQLTDVVGHTAEDNALRVAISNQVRGIDIFVSMLRRAAYFKDKVVSQQQSAMSDVQDPLE